MSPAPEIRPLRHADTAPAFALATEVFVRSSTLHRALNIGLADYRAYLRAPFAAMVAEGLSVVATDSHSQQILGCLIVTDFHGQSAAPPVADARFRPLAALGAELARQYRAQRSIVPGEVALVDMAAVAPSATGAGLYSRMRAAAHGIARDKGYRHVVGELSSAATQHVVLTRLQHRKMAEVAFAGFVVDGQLPFRRITQPPGIILTEGDL